MTELNLHHGLWYRSVVSLPVERLRIRFTLAQLLAGISACCGILVGYQLFGLFGAAVAALFTGVAFFIWGRRTHRPGVWIGGIALAVPSAGVTCLAVLGIIFLDIGPVYDVKEWPWGFEEMVRSSGADASDAKVYCRSRFIDSEYVWRLSLSPDQTQQVIAEFDWITVPRPQVPSVFWQAFPFWWRPTSTTSCQFFSTPGFPVGTRGPDGDYYLVMYDPQKQFIYVWNKFNF